MSGAWRREARMVYVGCYTSPKLKFKGEAVVLVLAVPNSSRPLGSASRLPTPQPPPFT